jgi:hypothetical protein
MKSADYVRRTEQNVIDSDGAVIFTIKPKLTGGSKRTMEFATKHRRESTPTHRTPRTKLSSS